MAFRNFWPVYLWAFFIFVLSILPGDYIPQVITLWDWLGPDKIAHLLFYGVFGFLLLMGFNKQYHLQKLRYYLAATFIAGTLFGLIIELLQHYVFKGRNGNVYDAAANVIGVIIGISSFVIYKRKKLRNKNTDS
ncbi:MAG: VanZ family protein [Bacteroidales bacterium]|nr:VanZ family protein [Bacteroidales bacterium]MCF8345306.1 VanZ family protein [Bacteroidales bacterium]MCF8352481.1 VanZ family protein [Bacteroidales bacterium]MCF8376390.1 VanZ family protein [Bacteroidales bacterium]MCF8401226.1 VanZ family protein [Bacteroidales bacterium]